MSPTLASRDPLLAFSWGYEGWGNHTRELVEMVDAVEAARGFAPPTFVDVRIRRAVRAVGFRERAFEALLGPDRYLWMPALGNKAVTGEADAMELKDPRAAADLLALVRGRAAARSRIVFFCACGSPLRRAECHRGLVADELVAAARREKTSLAVHEWPGGSPVVSELPVDATAMKRLLAGATRLPVPPAIPLARAAALPHFSILRCTHAGDAVLVTSGAATLTAAGWVFPVHSVASPDGLAVLRATLDVDLAEHELTPLGARLALPKRWRREPLIS